MDMSKPMQKLPKKEATKLWNLLVDYREYVAEHFLSPSFHRYAALNKVTDACYGWNVQDVLNNGETQKTVLQKLSDLDVQSTLMVAYGGGIFKDAVMKQGEKLSTRYDAVRDFATNRGWPCS